MSNETGNDGSLISVMMYVTQRFMISRVDEG